MLTSMDVLKEAILLSHRGTKGKVFSNVRKSLAKSNLK